VIQVSVTWINCDSDGGSDRAWGQALLTGKGCAGPPVDLRGEVLSEEQRERCRGGLDTAQLAALKAQVRARLPDFHQVIDCAEAARKVCPRRAARCSLRVRECLCAAILNGAGIYRRRVYSARPAQKWIGIGPSLSRGVMQAAAVGGPVPAPAQLASVGFHDLQQAEGPAGVSSAPPATVQAAGPGGPPLAAQPGSSSHAQPTGEVGEPPPSLRLLSRLCV
jgi:hypothetical protein